MANLIRKYGAALNKNISDYLFGAELRENEKRKNDFIREVASESPLSAKYPNSPVNALKCGHALLRGTVNPGDRVLVAFVDVDFRDKFMEIFEQDQKLTRKIQETLTFLHPPLYRGSEVEDIYAIVPEPLHSVIQQSTGVSKGTSPLTLTQEDIDRYTESFKCYIDKAKIQLVHRYIDGE